MRKLIYGINITLDGCCDHTKGIADEEVHDYFAALLNNADTLVYGRKTYELMVPFWPDIARDNSATIRSMREFAQAFVGVKNILMFSRSTTSVADKNTKVISSDLQQAILQLKSEEGKNILLGGVDLPSQLMKLDLIDEYHFVVQPIIAGEGTRLLEGTILPETLKLKLVESKTFKSGSTALRYLKA